MNSIALRTCALFLFALLTQVQSLAQYSQTRDPGLLETVPSPACMACPGSIWSNEMNAQTLNGSSASVVNNGSNFCFQSTCYYSRTLLATQHGFSIPSNATITGIGIHLNMAADADTTSRVQTLRIYHSGAQVGTSQGAAAFLTTNFLGYQFGGPADDWGLGALLTPAFVNDPTFGVGMITQNYGVLSHELFLDHLSITVYYFTCGMSFTEQHTDNPCFGDSLGTATVHVTGSTGPYSFQWSPYGGTDSSATGLAAGTFQVAVTDGNGCTDTTVVTILHPTPHSTILTQNICIGDSFFVQGAWQTQQGTYVDSFLTAGGCDSLSYTNLLIDPLPVVSLSLTLPDTLCNSETLQLLAGGSPSGGSFSGTGVTGNTFSPSLASPGWNVITYTYEEETGCINSATDSVFIDVCTAVTDPFAQRPAWIAPNPSKGDFELFTPGWSADSYTITDAAGRILFHERSASLSGSFKEKTGLQLQPGLYWVNLEAGGAVQSLRLLVIE